MPVLHTHIHRHWLRALAAITLLFTQLLVVAQSQPALAFTQDPATVFINEIHYDNVGVDLGEAVEIAGPAGTNMSGWSIVRYNGTNPASGVVYTTPAANENLSGTIPNLGGTGYGVLVVNYPKTAYRTARTMLLHWSITASWCSS